MAVAPLPVRRALQGRREFPDWLAFIEFDRDTRRLRTSTFLNALLPCVVWWTLPLIRWLDGNFRWTSLTLALAWLAAAWALVVGGWAAVTGRALLSPSRSGLCGAVLGTDQLLIRVASRSHRFRVAPLSDITSIVVRPGTPQSQTLEVGVRGCVPIVVQARQVSDLGAIRDQLFAWWSEQLTDRRGDQPPPYDPTTAAR